MNINILIKVKDFGEMKLVLYKDKAPLTVENFIDYVEKGYYNNLTFHRIIKGFMIQGGWGDNIKSPIKGEFRSNGIENDLKHSRGVISMARTNIKDSATSQFFIMHKDSPHLDGDYAAFGILEEGFDILDKIANVETNFLDEPTNKVIIESIEIL